jgi:UDP-N-acetylmuramate dehydrogenase
MSVNAHGFDYRKSIFMENKNLICIGANFSLKPCEPEKIYAKMNEYISSRKEKQPLEYPSAGSYFKRPEGHFAGKLIEDCGLKGFRVGDAAISEKHAGFVINLGRATAEDILSLEEQVRDRVFKEFGVQLEREVRVIK